MNSYLDTYDRDLTHILVVVKDLQSSPHYSTLEYQLSLICHGFHPHKKQCSQSSLSIVCRYRGMPSFQQVCILIKMFQVNFRLNYFFNV